MTKRFLQCANARAAMGELSPEWQDVWRETYEAFYTGASAKMGPDAADAYAARETLAALDYEVKRRQKLLLLQKTARKRILDGVQDFKQTDKLNKNAQMAAALKRLMENVGGRAGAPFSSVQGRYRATLGQAHALMADVIEKFEAGLTANLFGVKARATLANVVREAFGEDTGDESAKALAKGWAETADYMRQRANAAGADIAKRADWGLPQQHNAFAIRRAAKDPKQAKQAWIDFVKPLVDPERMPDVLTGQPISAERLDLALSNMYEAIVSEGRTRLKEGGAEGMGKLANRRQDHRFLAFKSADAWMAYQARFGEADAFSAMMGHIDSMARDVARLEILGPDPDRNWIWLKQEAQRQGGLEEARGDRGAMKRADNMAEAADLMHETFKGTFSSPSSENMLASGMSGLRGYLTAAQLGSSVISDIPSAPVFGAMARSFVGLDRAGDMTRLVKLLNPASDSDRKIARRAGFVIDTANDGLVNQAYYNESLQAGAIATKLPAAVMRVTGQSQFTAARKRAFTLEFMGALGDVVGLSLDDMAGQKGQTAMLAKTLKRWGFKADDWDAIRSAPLWSPEEDVAFMRAREIETAIGGPRGTDLAMRVTEMIQQETIRAVPENSLYARAQLLGGTKAGTVWGEIVRSVGMYRGFVVTLGYTWGMELAGKVAEDGLAKGAVAVGGTMTALVVAAGLAIQMREIAKGNEPRPMDDHKFWLAAIPQSGGLGILGDFFYSAQSRTGSGSAMAAMGPAGQFVGDVLMLGNETLRDATGVGIIGDQGKARPARRAATMLRNYTPISTIWWARSAWDRGVIAAIRNATDPEAAEYYGLQRKRLAQEGRDYWWAPGGEPNPAELLDGSQPVE